MITFNNVHIAYKGYVISVAHHKDDTGQTSIMEVFAIGLKDDSNEWDQDPVLFDDAVSLVAALQEVMDRIDQKKDGINA